MKYFKVIYKPNDTNRWTSKILNAFNVEQVYDQLQGFLNSDDFEVYEIIQVIK